MSQHEIARCIEELEGQGYATLEGVLDHAFCDEIIAEIRRLEAMGPPNLPANEFTGFETLRYFDLLNAAEIWQRVATQREVLEVARGILGNDMLLSTMVMLAHSRERMASFPPLLQQIIGFRPSVLKVGHINAGDPMQVLKGVEPDPV